jgi:hypothetical protein
MVGSDLSRISLGDADVVREGISNQVRTVVAMFFHVVPFYLPHPRAAWFDTPLVLRAIVGIHSGLLITNTLSTAVLGTPVANNLPLVSAVLGLALVVGAQQRIRSVLPLGTQYLDASMLRAMVLLVPLLVTVGPLAVVGAAVLGCDAILSHVCEPCALLDLADPVSLAVASGRSRVASSLCKGRTVVGLARVTATIELQASIAVPESFVLAILLHTIVCLPVSIDDVHSFVLQGDPRNCGQNL